jgi:phage shock protein PspC (stress-responsive transcriptional regulator)
MINKIKHIIERHAFGVCDYIGEKMGVATSRVRLYFIYLTFAALGSPVLVYLFIAFWINIKAYIRQTKNFIWND